MEACSVCLPISKRRYEGGTGVTWSCEKFRDYILRKRIEIETDHRPLVPLLSNKRLDGLPPRVLQFCLRLDKFNFQTQHVPYVADALSRAPLPESDDKRGVVDLEEVEAFIAHVATQMQFEQQSLNMVRQKQTEDEVCSKIGLRNISFIQK